MLHTLFARLPVIAASFALCSCVTVDKNDDPEPDCAIPVSQGPVAEKIRALEEAGASSNVTGVPLETAERMFWPDYVTVAQDGTVTPRESILRDWKPTPWASRFEIKQLDIRVYCDTAVVVGLSEAEALGAPTGTNRVRFRWLNVWTESKGEWRLSATHFARFRPPAN